MEAMLILTQRVTRTSRWPLDYSLVLDSWSSNHATTMSSYRIARLLLSNRCSPGILFTSQSVPGICDPEEAHPVLNHDSQNIKALAAVFRDAQTPLQKGSREPRTLQRSFPGSCTQDDKI
jgi:hypothetical protein